MLFREARPVGGDRPGGRVDEPGAVVEQREPGPGRGVGVGVAAHRRVDVVLGRCRRSGRRGGDGDGAGERGAHLRGKRGQGAAEAGHVTLGVGVRGRRCAEVATGGRGVGQVGQVRRLLRGAGDARVVALGGGPCGGAVDHGRTGPGSQVAGVDPPAGACGVLQPDRGGVAVRAVEQDSADPVGGDDRDRVPGRVLQVGQLDPTGQRVPRRQGRGRRGVVAVVEADLGDDVGR